MSPLGASPSSTTIVHVRPVGDVLAVHGAFLGDALLLTIDGVAELRADPRGAIVSRAELGALVLEIAPRPGHPEAAIVTLDGRVLRATVAAGGLRLEPIPLPRLVERAGVAISPDGRWLAASVVAAPSRVLAVELDVGTIVDAPFGLADPVGWDDAGLVTRDPDPMGKFRDDYAEWPGPGHRTIEELGRAERWISRDGRMRVTRAGDGLVIRAGDRERTLASSPAEVTRATLLAVHAPWAGRWWVVGSARTELIDFERGASAPLLGEWSRPIATRADARVIVLGCENEVIALELDAERLAWAPLPIGPWRPAPRKTPRGAIPLPSRPAIVEGAAHGPQSGVAVRVSEAMAPTWRAFVAAARDLERFESEFGSDAPLREELARAIDRLLEHGGLAIEPLNAALADRVLAGAAAGALGRLGRRAEPAFASLARLARGGDTSAWAASLACATINPDRTVAEGLHLDPCACLGVLSVLAEQGRAPEALAAALRARDPTVRAAAASLAEQSPTAFPRPALLHALADPDSTVRERAMSGLAKLPDPSLVGHLVEAQRDGLGPPPVIVRVADDPGSLVLVETLATRGLRDRRGRDYATEVCAYLVDRHGPARLPRATRARLRSEIERTLLGTAPREILFESTSRSAIRAAQLASVLEDPSLVDVLRAALSRWTADPSWEEVAHRAIARLEGRSAAPLVLTWLDTPPRT